MIDFTLFELKIASAIFLSRRGDHKAIAIVVGGIFDLHGTANQKDRFSQILKLFKCYKIIGLSIIDHPPKSPLMQ